MEGGWLHILWILAAAGLGYSVAWYFAGVRGMRRRSYLVPYVALSSALFGGYLLWSEVRIDESLMHNLALGLVAAALIGAFLVFSVMRQPASPRLRGMRLVADMVWSGVIYGVVDSALLSVLPVLAIRDFFGELGWGSSIGSDLLVGAMALASSALVTAVYHLGYPEFRNRSLILPVFALVIGSAGYLLTGNPIAVVGSHAAMHVAAVLRGPEGTIQLPPHDRARGGPPRRGSHDTDG
ncbi:MAG: hypothetical protein AB1793_02850 [Candidatus Thermoplasmatota archaeon]